MLVNPISKVESCSASLSICTWFSVAVKTDFERLRYFNNIFIRIFLICLENDLREKNAIVVEFTSPEPSWHVIMHPKKPVRYPRWLLLMITRFQEKLWTSMNLITNSLFISGAHTHTLVQSTFLATAYTTSAVAPPMNILKRLCQYINVSVFHTLELRANEKNCSA